jgi:glycosyltransferase involved in cell wall biosynthesis
VAGEGTDRARLEEKANSSGQGARVAFAGYVEESRKADLLRCADAFVMPGRGEGFGIAYIEAMACGIPVVGSSLDASRETLQGGQLGTIVDPRRPAQLVDGIVSALAAPKRVPEGISRYSAEAFRIRTRQLCDRIWPVIDGVLRA